MAAGIVLACPEDTCSSDFREDVWEAVRGGAAFVRVVGEGDACFMLLSERPVSEEDAVEWLRLEEASCDEEDDEDEDDGS